MNQNEQAARTPRSAEQILEDIRVTRRRVITPYLHKPRFHEANAALDRLRDDVLDLLASLEAAEQHAAQQERVVAAARTVSANGPDIEISQSDVGGLQTTATWPEMDALREALAGLDGQPA